MAQKKLTPKLTIEVCAHWAGLREPQRMGNLHALSGRGREIFSFEYDHSWLKNSAAQILDPALHFYPGLQYAPEGQANFGIFLDSAPDRCDGLKLNISESDNAQDLDLALEVVPYFRLTLKQAEGIIKEVVRAVRNWRKRAKKYKIPKVEQDRMACAFRIADSASL